MKIRNIITIAVLLLAANLQAQTADTYVANGRTELANTNLNGAYSDFTAALALSPNHPAANVLAAATRLLLLPQNTTVANFLTTKLGLPTAGRDIFNWTAQFQRDANNKVVLPGDVGGPDVIPVYTTAVMPAVDACLANLAVITDTNFTLTLYASETHVSDVTLDYGDIMLLRALLYGADFMGHTLNAHNFPVYYNYIKSLGQNNQLSIQTVLSAYPSLLAYANTSELAPSRTAFTNAIARYLDASAFIRNQRAPGVERLFELAPEKTDEEANFRNAATKALASVTQPVVVSTNSTDQSVQSLYLGAYFAGTKSLRSLVPQFNGNQYVYNSLPDYTFGGVLINEPAVETEKMLRKKLAPSYAGIYVGSLAGYNMAGYNYGQAGLALFVGPNNQGTAVGYAYGSFDGNGTGIYGQFTLDSGGNWNFSTNGFYASGTIYSDGTVDGQISTPDGGFLWADGVSHAGDDGSYASAEGYYTGTWSAGVQSGKLQAVVSSYGDVYYSVLDPSGMINDGGWGQLGPGNAFSSTSANFTDVEGTLYPATLQITGTINNPYTSMSGKISLSRSAVVSTDVAPTITSPPGNQTTTVGQSATFTVQASGSAPLCYQWYSNYVVLNGATSSTLTVNNLQAMGDYPYSVLVRNLVGSTNAGAVLHVSAETNKPTVSITTPYSGQRVSYAVAQVSGTASDNVAVGSVWYQVNSSTWQQAVGTTSWTGSATLQPGANTLRAFAIDTSGNISTTNSVTFTYVVSAPLVVQIGGSGTGTVYPNYNGSMLEVGASYTMYPYAGSGCSFGNWTGSVTSSTPSLTFVMASNLVFTANFVDNTKPTLYITTPYSSQRVSNSVFTVTGTASDNVLVSSVLCQVNNGPWVSANGTTNWSANVTLVPGNNTVRAYALDGAGTASLTNSVSFDYVQSTALVVKINGGGTVSPNYNGSLLELGASYTMYAYPASGCTFANWTGSVTNTSTSLTFQMAPNLTFIANFVDAQKPTVSIGTPYSSQRFNSSNGVVAVSGTAWDNVLVSNVWCRANSGPWVLASGTNNWSANVTLAAGANTVQAYSVDSSGNCSTTNSVACTYVVSAPLTVQVTGLGTVSPNYNGTLLEIGASYTLYPYAGSGCTFSNWTGSVTSTTPYLTFQMASNLTFIANFVDAQKPTVYVSAPYWYQRIASSNGVVTATGTASDNVQVSSVWCRANSNAWVMANGTANWSANLTLTPGPNTVQAYSVDNSGNCSTTNSLTCTYVVSAPLTVHVTGLGSVYPDDNGKLLELGASYTLYPYAGSGCTFSNWTGSVTSTTPSLTFQMASNLTFIANFVDLQKPTVYVSAPYWYQRITSSNGVITATGTASDNVQVSSVWCRANSNAWVLANGTTAWSANLTLTPGPNTVQAYSVDNSGNCSTTNSLTCTYVVSAPLTVHVTGLGSVSPDYNGKLLELGASYTLYPYAGSGCTFSNWTGSVTSTTPYLTFQMASNLTFTANFVDLQKPTVYVSAPYWYQRITSSNGVISATGTASDNVQVSSVWCRANSNAWVMANGTANWSANLTLTPGPNTVQTYAVDSSGNCSTTNSLTCTYVVSAPLTVHVTGLGSVYPDYNGKLLELGASYTLYPYAGYGCTFSNWTGSVTSTTPYLTFQMASNLTFTANFVDSQRPALYIAAPYWYQRIISSNSLFTVKGTASDNVALSNVWCQVNSNGWVLASGTNNWSADLNLKPGPNTVQVFAVDTSGNCSLTSSVPCTYVVTAPLSVQVTGLGTVYPSYNGLMLELGATYTLYAYAGWGCAFTNWTGSVTNNNWMLTFQMASNLTFIANFVDVQKPTLYITAPYYYQRWSNSNSVFTVKGTASDNIAVTNVWCQVNSNGWVLASGTNNWSADLNLKPGPNTVQAYAVDTSGNCSTTNSVVCTYVVTTPLSVQVVGLGSVYPSYNGSMLEVGATYTLYPYPGSGCAFVNWTGSINTNVSALTFVMASNLTFVAHFADVQKPTLYVSSPYWYQRYTSTNPVFSVKGTAYDNVGVSNVWCQVNSNGWVQATGTNNWSADVILTPGANTLQSYAMDTTGNCSLTNSLSMTFVVTGPLIVRTNGIGTIYAGFSGNVLEIGQKYTVTAYPGTGQVFSNWWVGSAISNSATLNFTMQSNLVLTANFVANPFLQAQGTYNGLFSVASNRLHESSGFLTMYVGDHGYYSGNFQMGGQYYYLSGQSDVSGTITNTITRSGASSLSVNLSFNFSDGSDQLNGTISSAEWVAGASADKAITYNGSTTRSPYAANYTLILPGSLNPDGTVYQGDGYGTLSVSAYGNIQLSGYLADNTYLYQYVPVSSHGRWPLYQTVNSGKGSLWGWLFFDTNQPPQGLQGDVSWIKPPTSYGAYPAGFTNALVAMGSSYTPIYTNRVIDLTNAVVVFEGGNLGASFTNQVTLSTGNQVSNNSSNYLTLTLSVGTGQFYGYVIPPGKTSYVYYQGALFQGADRGYGFFMGTSQSGGVTFQSPTASPALGGP